MYIPEHFRSRHDEDTLAFQRANPFAIIVSTAKNVPYASHIPVLVKQNAAGEQILRGHFAKANPHWQHIEKDPQCLTIFHGPHAYISPSLYADRQSVPTWNYTAVHVYGKARLYTAPAELQPMLDDLIATFELAYATQWASLEESYRQKMLSHIVGFEITATQIEAKFKLSQNRTKQDQSNVMAALCQSEDTAISGTGCLMRELGLGVHPPEEAHKREHTTLEQAKKDSTPK